MIASSVWPRANDLLAAAVFEWTFYWQRRWLRVATIFAALPVLLSILVALIKIADLEHVVIMTRGVDMLPYLFTTYYLRILVVILPLLSSAHLVSREVEGGTLPFLLVRPLSRSSLFLGKFFGSWWTLCALCCGSYLAVTLILLAMDGFADSGEILLATPAYLLTLCAGALGYGAFFAFIGMVTGRPALVGLFVGFLWENVIPYLPGVIRNFTVRQHLSALIPDLGMPSAWLGTADVPPLPSALGWLLFGVVVYLLVGAFVFTRRDYT